jgi:hypothetical protein
MPHNSFAGKWKRKKSNTTAQVCCTTIAKHMFLIVITNKIFMYCASLKQKNIQIPLSFIISRFHSTKEMRGQ